MKNLVKLLAATPIATGAMAAAMGFLGTPALAADSLLEGSGTPLFTGAFALPSRPSRKPDASASVDCIRAWRSTIPANSAQLWYTVSLPHSYALDWSVMTDTTASGPGVGLTNVITQQPDSTHAVYWLRVVNFSKVSQAFEMRVCLLN